jgi:hypothetical protein
MILFDWRTKGAWPLVVSETLASTSGLTASLQPGFGLGKVGVTWRESLID